MIALDLDRLVDDLLADLDDVLARLTVDQAIDVLERLSVQLGAMAAVRHHVVRTRVENALVTLRGPLAPDVDSAVAILEGRAGR